MYLTLLSHIYWDWLHVHFDFLTPLIGLSTLCCNLIEKMNDTYDLNLTGSDIENPQESKIEGLEFVDIFQSKNELEVFLGSYTHKMTASHGENPGICSAPFSMHPSKGLMYILGILVNRKSDGEPGYDVPLGSGASIKHLLKNIAKHANQSAIFHIDGTC